MIDNIFLRLELFFLKLLGFDVKLVTIRGKGECLAIKASHLRSETFAEFALKAIDFFENEKVEFNIDEKELYIFYD